MSSVALASIITAVITVAGTLLVTFVRKPGQKDTTEAAVGQVQIDIATGALKLVATGLTEEVQRYRAELTAARHEVRELTGEVATLRSHIAKLESQLATRDTDPEAT